MIIKIGNRWIIFIFVRFFYYLEKLCIPKNTHIPPELKPRTQYRYSEIIYASVQTLHTSGANQLIEEQLENGSSEMINHSWCSSTSKEDSKKKLLSKLSLWDGQLVVTFELPAHYNSLWVSSF